MSDRSSTSSARLAAWGFALDDLEAFPVVLIGLGDGGGKNAGRLMVCLPSGDSLTTREVVALLLAAAAKLKVGDCIESRS